MTWNGPSSLKECEEFIKQYSETRKYSFEYRTDAGWIFRWDGTYKTIHEGDVIILDYKYPEILSKDEIKKKYISV